MASELMELTDRDLMCSLMETRGMLLRTLADEVGCSPSFIGHLRTGEREHARKPMAEAIAKALDVPMGVLWRPWFG